AVRPGAGRRFAEAGLRPAPRPGQGSVVAVADDDADRRAGADPGGRLPWRLRGLLGRPDGRVLARRSRIRRVGRDPESMTGATRRAWLCPGVSVGGARTAGDPG